MLDEIIKAARNPMQIALLLVLLTGIVFESKVPSAWSEWADTISGKAIIIIVFFWLEYSYQWTLGLLWLLFALLMISPQTSRIFKEGFAMQASPAPRTKSERFMTYGPSAPRTKSERFFMQGKSKENFNDISMIDKSKGKWFVEKLLKENPVAIKEREVRTYPVQD